MKVEILIVSYQKDFQWLDYCMASIEKFALGFNGVTLAIPSNGLDYSLKAKPSFPVKFYRYEEAQGKGMLHHEERICFADTICPDAEVIVHMDSDCVFTSQVSPSSYIEGGRPVVIWRPYATMADDPDVFAQASLAHWRPCVSEALGWEPVAYTMCSHPMVYPKELYSRMRQHIESRHGNFTDYVLSKKNEFPQTFAEHPTLGEFGYQKMQDAFYWMDCTAVQVPSRYVKSFWSHGGLDNLLNNHKTPRSIIEELLLK